MKETLSGSMKHRTSEGNEVEIDEERNMENEDEFSQ